MPSSVMNRAAMQKFTSKVLDVRFEMFGSQVVYEGRNLMGCHSAIQNNKELRDGGFALIHDFICRIRKCDLPLAPLCEKELKVDGVIYRIAEVINHPHSQEWKLGLRSSV